MARLLIVDGSQLMAWLVSTVAPDEVTVERATSFGEAEAILRDDPPDAAILNITPSNLDWNLLSDLCRAHRPPIPVLCCTAVAEAAYGEPDLPCPTDRSLSKPFSVSDLRTRVERLIDEIDFQGPAPRERPN